MLTFYANCFGIGNSDLYYVCDRETVIINWLQTDAEITVDIWGTKIENKCLHNYGNNSMWSICLKHYDLPYRFKTAITWISVQTFIKMKVNESLGTQSEKDFIFRDVLKTTKQRLFWQWWNSAKKIWPANEDSCWSGMDIFCTSNSLSVFTTMSANWCSFRKWSGNEVDAILNHVELSFGRKCFLCTCWSYDANW